MTELVPNRANGYAWRNGKLQNAAIYFALRPSGAFLSTVSDLAKWDAALNAGSLLKKPTLDEMWTPVKLNNGSTSAYGFGWELSPIRNYKQVNHGGSLPGFRAQYTRFVGEKLSIAVLTNGDNANASAIAIGVANFYIPGLIPVRVVAKVDPKIFDNYTGQYEGNPSQIVSVTHEAGKLMIQQGTGEKRELLPESETVFFINDSPRSTYTFSKNDTGQALLVVKQDDREVWRGRKK